MDDSAPQTAEIIVVGAGTAARHFVARMLQDPERAVRITVIGDEGRLPYDRSGLALVVAGAPAAHIELDREPFRDDRVRVIEDDRALHIDRAGRRVRTRSGRWYGYDTLVLATGTHPSVPDVPGILSRGCFALRTMEDAQMLRAFLAVRATELPRPLRAVVVGGDVAAVDVACTLQEAGVQTTLIDTADRVCAVEMSVAAAAALRRLIEARGIVVRPRTRLTRIDPDDAGAVTAVEFQDGTFARADLVVTVGARARDELARNAELPVQAGGGILVDRSGATEDPRILAIGDAAVGPVPSGLGRDEAQATAERAADALQGFATVDHVPARWSAAPGGIRVAALRAGRTAGAGVVIPLATGDRRAHGEVVLSVDARVVASVTTVGESASTWTTRLWRNDVDLHAVVRDLLADGALQDQEEPCGHSLLALPEDALAERLHVRGIATFPEALAAAGESRDCGPCLRRLAAALMQLAAADIARGAVDPHQPPRALIEPVLSTSRVEVQLGEEVDASLLLAIARLAAELGAPARIDRGRITLVGVPHDRLPRVSALLAAAGVELPTEPGERWIAAHGVAGPARRGTSSRTGGRSTAQRRGDVAPASLVRSAEGSA